MKSNYPIEHIRHSFAHVLAAAVQRLYPKTQFGIGPVIENGFYYDFKLPASIKQEDLPRIEKEMRKIIVSGEKFERQTITATQAKKLFIGQPFKLELVEDLQKYGTTEFAQIKEGGARKNSSIITAYKTGAFLDLCRGGHVSSTTELNPDAFALTKIASAYWRGNERNPQLTRIYGIAFKTKKELDEYRALQTELEKRDHRKLGQQLDLFVFSELVGPGLPLWTPKGTLLRQILDEFVWKLRQQRGYERVEIPHITKKDLYEKSGHWQKFQNELFKITTREGHLFAMKPMNCPHHTQIFNRKIWSYRELPQRYANTTMCYRDEQTGELAGLSRLRSFTQDDAHVFCRLTQVEKEFLNTWDIVDEFYTAVGFTDLNVRLSFHDPENSEKYLGSPAVWKKAEAILRQLAKKRGVKVMEAHGEAAFYGPKIDFLAKDSLGRQWQVATIQLDLNLPERFNLFCINEKGEQEPIVMIHAAIMGSIERFLSVLLEHYAGAFPLWLSPIQVAILSINDKVISFAQKIKEELEKNNIRVFLDDRNEGIGKKIREAELQKIPYSIIIGDKEVKSKKISVRQRGGKDLGSMNLKKFLEKINSDVRIKNKK